jgi:hypothetical protein
MIFRALLMGLVNGFVNLAMPSRQDTARGMPVASDLPGGRLCCSGWVPGNGQGS